MLKLSTIVNLSGPQRGFLALAWPSLVENVLLTTMGLISMLMVGRLGPDAVAGVGAATSVMNLLIVVFSGLAVGTTALVARRVGSGDRPGADAALRQSLVVGLALGLGIGALGVALAYPVLQLMGAEPEVARDGAIYLRGVMASTPLMVVLLIGNGSLRGSGDTRTPMGITGAANVANVVVAYPLIFGLGGLPAIGVGGAAWGIVAARAVGCALVLRALLGQQRAARLGRIEGWRPDPAILRPLLSIGGPAAAESGSVQLGLLAFAVIVIRLGTDAYAAQQIVFNAANFSLMPGLAFSVAATTMVGQALGAGDLERAEGSGWQGALSAAVWMSAMGAIFCLIPERIIGAYTSDAEVISLGIVGMRVVGMGQPMQAIASVLSGALRGAGDTRTTLTIGTASIWLVRVPLAFVLGITVGLGVTGVWLGWIGDWTLRAGLYAWAFYRGRWKTIRV